ncbi:MAG: PEP/pyruvate-binding domain-containing protein [Candidatus Zixiibacteriota bacterium]
MSAERISIPSKNLAPFDKDFFRSGQKIACIGSGSIGGKASGLAFIEETLASHFNGHAFSEIKIGIPKMVVIATNYFDQFIIDNNLRETAFSDMSDDYILNMFLNGKLPSELIENLRIIIDSTNVPLAIRSSSLLEDSMFEPFAGVYATKMIPNNQSNSDIRTEKLGEAIKFVYASSFFSNAKSYHRAIDRTTEEEKMAVIVQEIVGQNVDNLFYPHISGVARSYNFYPSGAAQPEDGIVSLALGLGKTIVDGGIVWSYSPKFPRVNPPASSPRELLKLSQSDFWAVDMGNLPVSKSFGETEYLQQGTLSDAEQHGTLRYVASTYRPHDDRIVLGTGPAGPRILTFAPILVANQLPLNDLLNKLLKICEQALKSNVEIEFAMTINSEGELSAQFGFLQVRQMVVSDSIIDLQPEELQGDDVLAASDRSLGNGIIETIEDIIYVDPDKFDAKNTKKIASELADLNRYMLEQGNHYLLIGFGRWGSSDPWLGIPVSWGQISGAKALVEATLPGMDVELSQGAHFFHNMTSFQIYYFAIHYNGNYTIEWDWLKSQKIENNHQFVKHIHLSKPLTIKVDGRSRRGVILK